MHPSTYLDTHPGSAAPIGLAIFTAYQIGMWFYSYKNDAGYGAAALAGLALSEPAIASVFIPQVTDQRLDTGVLVVFCYLALSHFAYAIANWKQSTRSWLDL
jgi:hypothetical protein